MSNYKVFRKAALAALIAGPVTAAMATNGMNMEGYGPIATAMGGAAQAYDNGNAAMAQNPAALSLMEDGSRLDLAVGFLGPKVNSSMTGYGSADSGGTSYMMPAFGYSRKSAGLTFGVGIFAQGGMGTEYAANTFMAGASGQPARSELGVGKVIFPVSYQVNPKLAVGGALDFMWASLDVMMNMSGQQAAGLITGASGGFASQQAQTAIGGANYVRVDFSDGDKYTGAAKSTGYSAKLGFTYKADDKVTLGGSYQFKSNLGDMKTAAGSAKLSSDAMGLNDTGTMTVRNFQWPSILAIGASWQASPTVLVAADVKSIGWAEVMKDFKMSYVSESANMGSVSFALPQNWKDQAVFNLGVAWKATGALTLRAGVNIADNPIPDANVNPLFPATVKSHYTAGLGYQFSKNNEFNMSVVYAPKVEVTNASGSAPVTISHEQTNWQLMYTHRY